LKVNKKVVSEVEEQVTPTFKTSFLYITCEMGVITKNTKLGTICNLYVYVVVFVVVVVDILWSF
jgi:hypothetical protein